MTGAPIKFGYISDDTVSGSPGPFGNDVPTTTKRWQDYINSHGGINGHPVQVIEKDDESTAAIALQDFEALQSDGAVAVGDFSFVDKAFEQQADAAHIPIVGAVADASSVYITDPNFFPTVFTELSGPFSLEHAVQEAGIHKLAVIYCAEVAACNQVAQILSKAPASFGYTVTSTESFSASSPNYTAQCLAAKGAGSDGLFVSAAAVTAAKRVIDNCAEQGWKPKLVVGGVSPQILSDPNIQYATADDPILPWFVNTSATAPFNQAMGSYLPSSTGGGSLDSDIWENLEAMSYAAQAGIPAGATPTSQAMYNGLYTFKDQTLGGLAPPLTYTQGKPGAVGCFFLFSFANGKLMTPYGLTPQCPPASS